MGKKWQIVIIWFLASAYTGIAHAKMLWQRLGSSYSQDQNKMPVASQKEPDLMVSSTQFNY